jgi:hypothetical protein
MGLLVLLVFLNEALSLKDPAVQPGYFFLDNKLSISVPVNHILHRLPIQYRGGRLCTCRECTSIISLAQSTYQGRIGGIGAPNPNGLLSPQMGLTIFTNGIAFKVSL